jgi:hypothetical protein
MLATSAPSTRLWTSVTWRATPRAASPRGADLAAEVGELDRVADPLVGGDVNAAAVE